MTNERYSVHFDPNVSNECLVKVTVNSRTLEFLLEGVKIYQDKYQGETAILTEGKVTYNGTSLVSKMPYPEYVILSPHAIAIGLVIISKRRFGLGENFESMELIH